MLDTETVDIAASSLQRQPEPSMPDATRRVAVNDCHKLLGTSIEHGRLLLQAIIGSGGSSVVFRALDRITGREYAVKCVPASAKPSETYASRKHERSLHLRVHDHPGIATLHRAFRQGRHVFLILDLYSGGDLYNAIERGVFIGRDHLVHDVFLQLCDAVAHCHARGVYHLDVKPENVLCEGHTSHVVLTDFGLATTQPMCSLRLPGSTPYAPPGQYCFMARKIAKWLIFTATECYQDREGRTTPAAASDVWALGIILVSLITTVNPWHVAEPQDANFALYIRDPQVYFDPLHLPLDVSALILRALTVDPYKRMPLNVMRKTAQNIPSFLRLRGGDYEDEESDGDIDSNDSDGYTFC